MKKYLLLSAAWTLVSFQAFAVSDCKNGEPNCWECGDNCTARLNENGELKVYGTGSMYDYTYSGNNYNWRTSAPWFSARDKITSLSVQGLEKVGASAFISLKNVTSVELDDTIKTLSNGSFMGMENLSSLTLPKNLESIGAFAFQEMSALREISIPPSVTTIEKWMFSRDNVAVFCTAEQKALIYEGNDGTYNLTYTTYAKDEDGNYIVPLGDDVMLYGNNGKIVGGYRIDENGNIVERYQYDESGNKTGYTLDGRVNKYDKEGHLISSTKSNADGSTYIYNKEGELTSIRGKKIYTVEEAEAVTAHGDKFHVFLTYK